MAYSEQFDMHSRLFYNLHSRLTKSIKFLFICKSPHDIGNAAGYDSRISLEQIFSMLFFFMLFVLGIGSNIAMCSCIITVIRDQFPKWKTSYVVLGVAFVGYLIGLVYITPVSLIWLLYNRKLFSEHCSSATCFVRHEQMVTVPNILIIIDKWFICFGCGNCAGVWSIKGGQFILNLVDFFGASYIVFILAIAEMVAVCWIYGKHILLTSDQEAIANWMFYLSYQI